MPTNFLFLVERMPTFFLFVRVEPQPSWAGGIKTFLIRVNCKLMILTIRVLLCITQCPPAAVPRREKLLTIMARLTLGLV